MLGVIGTNEAKGVQVVSIQRPFWRCLLRIERSYMLVLNVEASALLPLSSMAPAFQYFF